MRIVEYRFALVDDVDPDKVLGEIVRDHEGAILGGVLLHNTGFGHLIASNEVNETFLCLDNDDQREVAAALLRGDG